MLYFDLLVFFFSFFLRNWFSKLDTIGGNQLWWHGGISNGKDVSKFCEESGPRLVAILSGGRKWETLCGSLNEPMESNSRTSNVGARDLIEIFGARELK